MNQQDNLEYWNQRAITFQDDPDKATHQDLFQKKLELDFLDKHLSSEMNVLEVGCGNGFITEHISKYIKKVDAFDQSEGMIDLAKKRLSGRNNINLFINSLPVPNEELFDSEYDAVFSIRVLINIIDDDHRKKAIQWMANKVKTGGKLILMEGSADGLDAINAVRTTMGIDTLATPYYNINLRRYDIFQSIPKNFNLKHDHGFGIYDLITRILYPMLNKDNILQYNTNLHEAAHLLNMSIPGDKLNELSRMTCMVFEKNV
ncbi:MAG: class I SAM-dependent methyltransferase [Magnetococcus sp. DMHC-6]